MRTISCILATVDYNDAQMAAIRQAVGPSVEIIRASPKDAPAVARALERADVAILASDLDDRFLKAPKLRWIHCDHAGLNKSARPEVFDRGLIVSGSAGRSAPALAEHSFFFMLNLTYRVTTLLHAQAARRWDPSPLQEAFALYGKTLGIVGMGHTGAELAPRAKAFGMKVLAFRRKSGAPPEGVDRLYASDRGESLDPLLRESDYLVLCVSLTDRTYHLIGSQELARMKPSAFLINMARGAVVDESALIAALEKGTIAGAGLDTTEREPLPPDSPLWDAPNLLITPHATPRVPDRTERSIAIICENIRRYRAEEPLLNQLTPDELFSRA